MKQNLDNLDYKITKERQTIIQNTLPTINEIREFITSMIRITGRSGLIVFDWRIRETRMVFHTAAFLDYFRRVFERDPTLLVDEVMEMFDSFFLQWNNSVLGPSDPDFSDEVVESFVQQVLPNPEFGVRLATIINTAQNRFWPAIAIIIRNPIDGKRTIDINLFTTQLNLNLEDLRLWHGFEESGELCGRGVYYTNKYVDNKNVNDNYFKNLKFECEVIKNPSEQQIQNLWLKKIRTVIQQATFSYSIYREIFNFDFNNLDQNLLKNKILFKLNKIITIKYPKMPYAFIINPIGDIQKNGDTGYWLKLKINLLDKNMIKYLTSKETTFQWNNKYVIQEIDFSKKFDFIKMAIIKTLAINKTFFYKTPNSKVFHLSNFFQNLLEDISLDFLIVEMPKNIFDDLKTANCYFKINYQNKWAFDATFINNETIVFKRMDNDSKKGETISQKHLDSNPEQIFAKERAYEKVKKLMKILRTDFQGLWSRNDSLYEITNTFRHLMNVYNEHYFANANTISTSLFPKKKLSTLVKRNFFNGKEHKGLNFSLYFNSYNYKLEINNFDQEFIKIFNTYKESLSLLWKKIINISFVSNSFIKTNGDLLNHINNLSLTIDYIFNIKPKDLNLNLSFKNSPFIVDILIDGKLINTIKLDWKNLKWLLIGNDKKEIKVKDEL